MTAIRTRSGSSKAAGRLRGALVLAEVAGTVVLLIASGLLLRAMWRVQGVDPGFQPRGVLTMQTMLPIAMPPAARRVFYDRVLADVRALPGVRAASYISFLPMTFPAGNLPVTAPGVTLPTELRAHLRFVVRDYFTTMGIPLVAGRDVSDRDVADSTLVALVSESLARTLWPGLDPLGRTLRVVSGDREVVGVVRDVAVRGLEAASLPQLYLPADQLPPGLGFYAPKDLVIKSGGDPMTLLPAVRTIVRAADPTLAIGNVTLLDDLVFNQTATRRAQLAILLGFAAIALVLAGVGIYGLLSYAVSSRVQEIGVRMALGAARSEVVGMILRQGVVLGAAGLVSGVPLAYFAARSLQAILFGVPPGDPVVFAIAALVAFALTVIGSLRPALRAAKVDPVIAIRAD